MAFYVTDRDRVIREDKESKKWNFKYGVEELRELCPVPETWEKLTEDDLGKAEKDYYTVRCFSEDHEDKNPSLCLWKFRFKCFRCDEIEGDVFDLVAQYKGWDIIKDFQRICRWLQKAFNLEHLEVIDCSDTGNDEKELRHKVLTFFMGLLSKDSPELKKYKESRGPISENTWKEANVGFMHEYKEISVALKNEFPLDVLQAAGLFNKDGKFIFYKHKIIFSVIRGGKLVGIQARMTDDDFEKEKEKSLKNGGLKPSKRLSLSGVKIDYMYGMDSIKKDSVVLLGEGPEDRNVLHDMGFNAVSLLTGAMGFKEEWADHFTFCKAVYTILDSDQAGKDGAMKVGEILDRKGIDVRIARLPEGKDVNDVFREGAKRSDFDEIISRASRPLELLMSGVSTDVDELDRVSEVDKLMKYIAALPSERHEPYNRMVKEWLRGRGWKITSPELKRMLSKHASNNEGGEIGMKGFSLSLLSSAQEFNDKYGPYIFVSGYWFQYINGVLLPADDALLMKHADAFLQNIALGKKKGNITTKDCMELMESVSRRDYVHVLNMDCMNKNRYLINFKNGMFNILTGELGPHDIEYLSTVQLPYNYDPNADCPRWKLFMAEILPDHRGARRFVQEFMGYCLVPETKHEKFVILTGEGGNGKSKLVDTLEHLVGKENCVHYGISVIGEKFHTIGLMNKLLNVGTENEDAIIKDTSILKKVVSGEPLEDSHKHKDLITFRPFCKLIFATNKMLRFQDSSDAFRRRLAVINFTEQFEGDNKDADLMDKLLPELPGIFNWALEGYRRIKQRGDFVESTEMKKSADSIRKHTSNVFSFVEDACVISQACESSRSELYEAYREYCKDNGYIAMSSHMFTAQLRKVSPHIEVTEEKVMHGYKRSRRVYGISLAENVCEDVGLDNENRRRRKKE